jgi:ribonuclease R
MAKRSKKKALLPTKQQILEFIRASPTPVGKREIARAFGIGGGDRIALKEMLREIAETGEVERGRGRRLARPASLPEVAVVEITGTDADGEVIARPLSWRGDTPPPQIVMAPERRGTPALGPGDRVVARLARTADGLYEGRTIRQLAGVPQRVVGVYDSIPGVGGRLTPTDRRVKAEYRIAAADSDGAHAGELVLAEVLHTHRLGALQARVVERLGRFGEPRTISLISIHEHDIPTEFPADALALAAGARPVALGARADLREVPLVTIDQRMPATTTTQCGRRRTTIPAIPADSACWWPSPTWRITCGPATRSTGRRRRAATPPISPTVSCRCCRRRSPTASAR